MLTGEIRANEILAVSNFAKRHGLKNRDRHRDKVYKRAYLIAYLTDIIGITVNQAGGIFNRDHTTAIHAKKVYHNYKNDAYFIRLVSDVREVFPMNKFSMEQISEPKIIELALTEHNYHRIQVYKAMHNIASDDMAINVILDKYLKI